MLGIEELEAQILVGCAAFFVLGVVLCLIGMALGEEEPESSSDWHDTGWEDGYDPRDMECSSCGCRGGCSCNSP